MLINLGLPVDGLIWLNVQGMVITAWPVLSSFDWFYREGSITADIQMTFNESVGESEVDSLLKETTKDGQFGQFKVDQARIHDSPIPGKLHQFNPFTPRSDQSVISPCSNRE